MIFMRHLRKFENFSLTGIIPMNEEVTTVGGIDVDKLQFGLLTKEEASKVANMAARVASLNILNGQFKSGSEMGKKWTELLDFILSTSPLHSAIKMDKTQALGARNYYFELLKMMGDKRDPLIISNLKTFIQPFANKMQIIIGVNFEEKDGKFVMKTGSGAPTAAKESFRFRG